MQGVCHHVQRGIATMFSHNASNVLHATFQSLSALQKPLDQTHVVFMESLGS